WAGLGYLFLRTVHVLVDVTHGRLMPPSAIDFAAYLLFAPTLRMGPIYCFTEFSEQIAWDPRRPSLALRALLGFGRIIIGLLRLGIMAALLKKFPIEPLLENPQSLATGALLVRLYVAPISIYLWISGYIDLAIGVGGTMGFRVPENFCYPWK